MDFVMKRRNATPLRERTNYPIVSAFDNQLFNLYFHFVWTPMVFYNIHSQQRFYEVQEPCQIFDFLFNNLSHHGAIIVSVFRIKVPLSSSSIAVLMSLFYLHDSLASYCWPRIKPAKLTYLQDYMLHLQLGPFSLITYFFIEKFFTIVSSY